MPDTLVVTQFSVKCHGEDMSKVKSQKAKAKAISREQTVISIFHNFRNNEPCDIFPPHHRSPIPQNHLALRSQVWMAKGGGRPRLSPVRYNYHHVSGDHTLGNDNPLLCLLLLLGGDAADKTSHPHTCTQTICGQWSSNSKNQIPLP